MKYPNLLATGAIGALVEPIMADTILPMRKLGAGVFDWAKRNRGSIACNPHKHEREIARRLRQGAAA